jgi:protease-4
MDGVAASGGLYAALAASKIFSNPGTMTGSIGVIMSVPNFTRLANWAGVDMVTIKSGSLKDAGNMYREMLPEERQYLEETATKVHEIFIQAVVDSRKIPRPIVEKFADGRIILGSEAKRLKLIDDIGGVYDAARAVYELAGKPLSEGQLPKIRYSTDRFEALRKIFKTVVRVTELPVAGVKMHYLMQ